MKPCWVPVILLLVGFILATDRTEAAQNASATISPDDTYTYIVECSDFSAVRSVELVVDYPSTMGKPDVIPGQVALANELNISNNMSILRVEITARKKPLPTRGILFYLWFHQDRKNNPLPVGLSGWVVGFDGKRTAVKTWYLGPNEAPPVSSDAADDSNEAAEAPKGVNEPAAPVYPEVTTVAGKTPVRTGGIAGKNTPEAPDQPNRPTVPERTGTAAATPAVAVTGSDVNQPVKNKFKSRIVYPSVLEKFRNYSGERTEAAFRRLFEPAVTQPFHQEPSVTIADGATPVTVTYELATPGQEISFMALDHAKLNSFKYLEDGRAARIVVTPEGGTDTASLSIVTEDQLFEIPLVVVPACDPHLPKSMDPDEQLARFDCNGDGTVDFRDDYILVGSRLAAHQMQTGLK